MDRSIDFDWDTLEASVRYRSFSLDEVFFTYWRNLFNFLKKHLQNLRQGLRIVVTWRVISQREYREYLARIGPT